MTEKKVPNIFLVIDDDEVFRKRLVRSLEQKNYIVYHTGDPEEASSLVLKYLPSHVILDLRMPKRDGLQTLREIKKVSNTIKVLLLTGYGSIPTAIEAVQEGATNYLTKPVNISQILDAFDGTSNTTTKYNIPPLDSVTWEYIQRVMSDCHGNISQAAKLLGLHRRSLQRKLKSPPIN